MMMVKSIWLAAAVLILVGGLPAGSSATETPVVPVPLYPGATIRTVGYSLYEHLELKIEPEQDGKGSLDVAGNLWEMWIDCAEENQTIKAHYIDLATRQGAVLAEPGINDLHFRCDLPEGQVFIKFHAQTGK